MKITKEKPVVAPAGNYLAHSQNLKKQNKNEYTLNDDNKLEVQRYRFIDLVSGKSIGG